ncbi:DUF6802 family protein [Amycolatopsis sp.]|uniref:DUF6802 family protein n=1 Tax=Amycolatopsis sp. TaxID=37632 RepID=UPI002E0CD6B5|nr:DUF6802 family protein [Amycolatopsis sp.]
MWVDETGGTGTGTGNTDGMTVHVDGEDYAAEVNYDIDHDGVNDTAIIEHEDGTAQAFGDTNNDGVADHYAVLDENGKVVEMATYDQASGQWVEAGGGDQGGGDQQTDSTGTIHADMPKGDVEVGPATIDTDHDGKNDTAVVQTKDGGTIAFTDSDGDGQADVAVEIDASGNATTYEHTGKGEWTEQPSGLVGEVAPDSDAAWGGGGTQTLEGVAKIDSVTGQWISPN